MPRGKRSPRAETTGAEATQPAAAAPTGDVYTMAEAARLKGVSYHTVSRAVRREKLPAQRLGRMALIAAEDLRAWRPMRERAPRKYRRREPNPEATPALLDLASGERVELARRLSTFYEVLHGAAAEQPLPDFLALLAERLAGALSFKRVAVWGIDAAARRAIRLAHFGPPLSRYPDEMPLDDLPIVRRALEARVPYVLEDIASFDLPQREDLLGVVGLFVAPLRLGDQVLGVVLGDCNGEVVELSPDELVLAQGLANQAALALDRARLRAEQGSRVEQLAAILENVNEAVFACDAAGGLTVLNAAGRALLGLGDGPLTGQENLDSLVAAVGRREFDGRPVPPEEVPLARAARGERVRDRQHLVVRPDGTERAVSVNAQPIRDVEGGLLGAVAVARDITAERAAAEREQQRMAQLEAASLRNAAVADVALAVNAESDLAKTLETAVGRMTDLLAGKHGAIFFREADGRMTGQVGYRLGEDAGALEVDAVNLPTTMVAFARRAPIYYTYAEAAPSERVFFDRLGFRASIIAPLIAGDELVGAAYVNYATAERRPTEEELGFAGALASQCAVAIGKRRLMDRLETAHQRLLAVVDQLPQGVVIVEAPSGRLVLANRAAEELRGGPLPEETAAGALGLAGADGSAFPPGGDPLTVTLRTGQGRIGEALTLVRPDGGRIAVLANHVPVADAQGRIVGAVSVLQDAAQLRALDRAKDEFLSIAAHELRNPLTSLHGNLQLLQRRVLGEPGRAEDAERLATIIAQSDRLAQLVGRLLDVSRAELGRLDLTPAPTDAAVLVGGAVSAARGLSSEHRIEAEVPERLPVVWDPVRVEQVVTNLITNAVKYTPGGAIVVGLATTDDDRVRLTVRDHGPGIPDEIKANLFDRYVRRGGDEAAEAPAAGNGLGLGLYISRLIARAHGGDLLVADAPGGGALFTLDLPRHAAVAGSGSGTPVAASLTGVAG